MKEIIATLASAFSIDELTSILRDISNDKSISDNTIRMFASALCLSWMDDDDVKYAADRVNSCDD